MDISLYRPPRGVPALSDFPKTTNLTSNYPP